MIKKIGILSLLLAFASCKVDPKINTALPADNLVEIVPQGWPQPNYTFSTNVISEPKFVLGRYLFYETMLSQDNTISCGSCHQSFVAFANADHALSHGINDKLGNRNAPALFNLAWHPYFMHDGGINHIEVQPLGPITNTVEMAEDISHVIAKLQASEKYKTLFKNAFGTEEVTSQRMLWAITQFQGLIYSYNSKYDFIKRGENKSTFTAAETRGYNLFLANCNACHKEPLFSDFQLRSNGLPMDVHLKDSGHYRIDKKIESIFKFKTPSLRNIAKTFPYMHDGRFSTLQQCLDHYTNGISNLTNLDPLLSNNGLQLSAQDKQDIIAFLNTLTDYKLIEDKRFTDPNFK